MKLLLFYTHHFDFQTAKAGLPDLPDLDRRASLDKAVVIFFHAEAEDEAKRAKVLQKFIKNTKWLCGKFDSKNVVLHSFNHLSTSKATPEFSKELLEETAARLTKSDFTVLCTPFGYFNEFNMHVAGDSLAKVFKEF